MKWLNSIKFALCGKAVKKIENLKKLKEKQTFWEPGPP